MSKLVNEVMYEAIEGDFDSFLARGEYDQCEVIIDNLADLGEYLKGVELATRLAKARMMNKVVPAGYGEEKSPFDLVKAQHDMVFNAARGKPEEEVIF